MKLEIELVPKSAWYSNVRSMVTRTAWDKLRNICYEKALYECQICGGTGTRYPVEAHEVWDYDDTNCVQKLMGLIALCPSCHRVKHFGLALKQGLEEQVIEHFMAINDVSYETTMDYLAEVMEIWTARNQQTWTCDLSWLDRRKIKYKMDRQPI